MSVDVLPPALLAYFRLTMSAETPDLAMAAIQEPRYVPPNQQKVPSYVTMHDLPEALHRSLQSTISHVYPFVCNICGKDFTGQHDRKIHEVTHVVAKFVCKGELKNGPWGCGRRHNRAGNLGLHFRGKLGKVCIQPLLVEEAEE
jgi:hypothetical protein